MITNKLEIDVMQANEIIEASHLAMKHKIPALVVHPSLTTDAILAKGRSQGQFKIITPVDWPKGEKFGTDKMIGLSVDAIDSDGFEIYLSSSNTVGDVINEAKALTNLIRNHISSVAEIRFVLGVFNREWDVVERLCEGLISIPTPSLIRTDINLKLQLNRANPDIHTDTIDKIKYLIGAPIKIVGNINTIESAVNSKGAAKYGVSLQQAKAIAKELASQPNQLHDLLKQSNEDKV